MPDARQLRALLLAAAAWLGCALATQGALAQVPVPLPGAGAAANPEAVESAEAGARKHFERALELYRGGKYAPALSELELAARLDPNGKDLFFNLALVHEKLGQLDEAIAALERFRELEQDPSERERAAVTIARLRGAELAAAPPSTPAPAPAPCPHPAPAPAHWQGRQALLIGAASVAVVSLVVGVVFGAQALSDDVSGQSTSSTLSAEALRQRAASAEREALAADVAFALAAASAGTFIGVWALSPAEPARRAAGINLRGYF